MKKDLKTEQNEKVPLIGLSKENLDMTTGPLCVSGMNATLRELQPLSTDAWCTRSSSRRSTRRGERNGS